MLLKYELPFWFLVALLAEGVDRNQSANSTMYSSQRSPSSRRAWIEISYRTNPSDKNHVALLAEGVDRNSLTVYWL